MNITENAIFTYSSKKGHDKVINNIWLINLVSPQFARKFFGKSIKYQEKQNGLLRQ